MDKHEAIAARADEAARILNSPLFIDICEGIRKAYFEEWAALETSDAGLAYDIHRRVKCLDDVRKSLTMCINAGKVLEKQQSLLERAQAQAKKIMKPLSNATGVR